MGDAFIFGPTFLGSACAEQVLPAPPEGYPDKYRGVAEGIPPCKKPAGLSKAPVKKPREVNPRALG